MKKALCRKELSLTLEELCAAAARCLKFGGRFALIHRADRLAEAVYTCTSMRSKSKRYSPSRARRAPSPYAVLIAAVKGGKPGCELVPTHINEREEK